jgi:hypothetical protein
MPRGFPADAETIELGKHVCWVSLFVILQQAQATRALASRWGSPNQPIREDVAYPMPTMTFERCDSGCGKFDHNAYTPANPGDLGEPLRSADDSQVNITSYSPRRVDAPPRELTCARFREVAKARGWTLDWLVSQVGRSIEEPTRTLQRLLKESSPDTVIPYMCLIELVKGATLSPPASAGEPVCKCGCGGAVTGRQQYATPYCRLKASRRRPKLSQD